MKRRRDPLGLELRLDRLGDRERLPMILDGLVGLVIRVERLPDGGREVGRVRCQDLRPSRLGEGPWRMLRPRSDTDLPRVAECRRAWA